jgi:hypothetical protein
MGDAGGCTPYGFPEAFVGVYRKVALTKVVSYACGTAQAVQAAWAAGKPARLRNRPQAPFPNSSR